MRFTFNCCDQATDPDLLVIDRGIGQYNRTVSKLDTTISLFVFVRDDQQAIVGGAVGRTWGKCCELQQLWVSEDARRLGIGSELLEQFELESKVRQCSQINLETFSFQAPRFYQARGYQVVLETSGFPDGVVKYSMRKHL